MLDQLEKFFIVFIALLPQIMAGVLIGLIIRQLKPFFAALGSIIINKAKLMELSVFKIEKELNK